MSLAGNGSVSLPLRILCVLANPTDAPRFDGARVWDDLAEGLRLFTNQGTVVVEQLADPTENGLRRALKSAPWHVLHVVAHAEERRSVHWGAITLQSSDGKARNLTTTYLADLLHEIPSLKLVVLQACDEACCFDTMAETLSEKGLPARAVPALRGKSAQLAIEELYEGVLAKLSVADAPKRAVSAIAAADRPIEPSHDTTVSRETATLPPPLPITTVPSVPEPPPVEVFYSYAHEDEDLRIALEKHLSLLQRRGLIVAWHDRRISAGDAWGNEIDVHIHTAQIILLLISADFLASDYCYGIEMKIALERHASHDAMVIPIILRPVDWSDASFSHLEALPRDAKPVTTWSNRDEALADIARGIRESLWRVSSRVRPPK
jgi:hypothetical protein